MLTSGYEGALYKIEFPPIPALHLYQNSKMWLEIRPEQISPCGLKGSNIILTPHLTN